MSEPLKSVGAITLFVDDPQRSKEFYARVFEAPPSTRTGRRRAAERPQGRARGMRTAALADPDGHVREVAARIR